MRWGGVVMSPFVLIGAAEGFPGRRPEGYFYLATAMPVEKSAFDCGSYIAFGSGMAVEVIRVGEPSVGVNPFRSAYDTTGACGALLVADGQLAGAEAEVFVPWGFSGHLGRMEARVPEGWDGRRIWLPAIFETEQGEAAGSGWCRSMDRHTAALRVLGPTTGMIPPEVVVRPQADYPAFTAIRKRVELPRRAAPPPPLAAR